MPLRKGIDLRPERFPRWFEAAPHLMRKAGMKPRRMSGEAGMQGWKPCDNIPEQDTILFQQGDKSGYDGRDIFCLSGKVETRREGSGWG